MAIKLTKELNTGVTGEYWRIMEVAFNATSGKVYGTLAMYIDKVSRDAGKVHVYSEKFAFIKTEATFDDEGVKTAPAVPFSASDFDTVSILSTAYDLIKARNTAFSSAVDA